MATVPELFQLALSFHQSGNLAQAEPLYKQVIQANFTHADAHNNLGLILHAKGQIADAVTCFRQALQFNPNHVDAYSNLGVTLVNQGQLEDAILCLRQALRLNPNNANAHNTLGVVLKENGKVSEAIMCFRQAIANNPNQVDAYCNLGVAFKEQGQLEDAILCLRQGMQVDPGHSDVHNNLGTLLKDNGQVSEAITCFRQAISINPRNASAHNNLGFALDDQGLNVEAIECFQKALAIDPNHADAHLNMGNSLRLLGKLNEALASYQAALLINPKLDDAHVNLGMLWLNLGNFEDGWAKYEWRQKVKKYGCRSFSQALWDGGSLSAKTILLHAEQGLGDTLQFIRYAPVVKRHGGTVLLECPAELVRIMQTCPGIDQVLSPSTPLPHFDIQAPLMSLPAILKTTLATIPASIPYLSADPALKERWRQELTGYSGFKIGIVWQGNPRLGLRSEVRAADKRRSIPLAQFETLAGLSGVQLFSLQKGFGTEQLAEWKQKLGIIELGDRLNDFMDTAAVMMNLDLVISADTSPAHLAGALGRRVWTALPFSGCWRWLRDREDCPWYPTMKLFWQSKQGDWEKVFQRMAAEIRDLLVKPHFK